MIHHVFQVALGGALGASARYGVSIFARRWPGFPVATMAVNILGSFLMGVIVVVLAHKGGQRMAPFLMTGLLGGFTTFSAFSLDAMTLWERGQSGQAMFYVLSSVVLSLVAIAAGMAATRWWLA